MNLAISFRPKLFVAVKTYSGEQFRRDFGAGLNVMVTAFPLPVAFAIPSGAKPEHDPLRQERQKLETVRRKLVGALERANEALLGSASGSRALSSTTAVHSLGSGNGKADAKGQS